MLISRESKTFNKNATSLLVSQINFIYKLSHLQGGNIYKTKTLWPKLLIHKLIYERIIYYKRVQKPLIRSNCNQRDAT